MKKLNKFQQALIDVLSKNEVSSDLLKSLQSAEPEYYEEEELQDLIIDFKAIKNFEDGSKILDAIYDYIINIEAEKPYDMDYIASLTDGWRKSTAEYDAKINNIVVAPTSISIEIDNGVMYVGNETSSGCKYPVDTYYDFGKAMEQYCYNYIDKRIEKKQSKK